uniref:Uncharacterized protein n=1 Tax=Rhizophora mucronata TaxID=61149 RepID=A0A2P2QZJ3_RHIMU
MQKLINKQRKDHILNCRGKGTSKNDSTG